MFTGIVEGRGRVVTLLRMAGGGARLAIVPSRGAKAFRRGESVCVSGVCLTALSNGTRFVADLSAETLRRSTLGQLRVGGRVNLERALVWGDRLSGHFVLGHVDGVSRLLAITKSGNSWTYRFSMPEGLARYLVEKGSVALDGTSLTIAARRRGSFDIAVIPETRRKTTMATARPGDRFNLEVDVFARYGQSGWRGKIPARRARRPR